MEIKTFLKQILENDFEVTISKYKGKVSLGFKKFIFGRPDVLEPDGRPSDHSWQTMLLKETDLEESAGIIYRCIGSLLKDAEEMKEGMSKKRAAFQKPEDSEDE